MTYLAYDTACDTFTTFLHKCLPFYNYWYFQPTQKHPDRIKIEFNRFQLRSVHTVSSLTVFGTRDRKLRVEVLLSPNKACVMWHNDDVCNCSRDGHHVTEEACLTRARRRNLKKRGSVVSNHLSIRQGRVRFKQNCCKQIVQVKKIL